MNCGELCTRDVVIVQERESAATVARQMRELHVGSVVIVRDEGAKRVPVGIITDRDIVVELVAKDIAANQCTAGDLVDRQLVTIGQDESPWDALTLMRDKGVRRLPVVDDSGLLLGILAADDLVDFVREQMGELSALIRREQNFEMKRRP